MYLSNLVSDAIIDITPVITGVKEDNVHMILPFYGLIESAERRFCD
jgi:hypothetical protein